ncbi:Craniofacial development protein 2 [Acropora cervicornis]|uniref:Craniofacial development protein 2 n=1 Tax=Acropora cervicornis TaxID=6130 RepID=A0AAD9Q777_ACRCE|nr:Craniofacial development protein 2 [Acropora cervicornis]
MCPGLSSDLQGIDDARKTAVINKELARLNIDVACLQETRLPDGGSLRETDYTFFWKGLSQDEPRQHGVGFAVRNSLLASVETPTGGSSRLLVLRMKTSMGNINILSAYAPTLTSTPEAKDQFYEALEDALSCIPKSECIYLLGDFNARVGADWQVWPTCLGHYGLGRLNENGQRLLELCCHHGLCITNSYFAGKDRHKVSWRHPRSGHWHQLDLVITRRADPSNVLHTRSYHSADCDTDHSLVASKVRLKPQRIHHAKTKGRPRINTCGTSDPDKVKRFADTFNERIAAHATSSDPDDAVAFWDTLRDAIYDSAMSTFGKKERKNADWLEAHWDKMEPVTEAKRKALLDYKQNPCPSTRDALKAARSKAQQTARRCANKYWHTLCAKIQSAADCGYTRGMYEGIKAATGPTSVKTAPLKSKAGETITEQSQQLQRWVEHYIVALDALPGLPVMEELDHLPTEEELSKAIDSLACGKAPGKDGIPPELLKQGKLTLLQSLHKLLCLCWEHGHIPQDMRDANIVTLYKNKGDRSDCNNYRGISLLSIVGKVFARVALNRVQKLASRVYPSRSAALEPLQEKCREQQQPLFIAFVDLTKAFDLVSRSGLFEILQKIGCPPKLLAVITSFHQGMQSTVCYDGATSEPFPVSSGVKQGCVLAPTLFGIFFSMLLQYAFADCEDGVYVRTRHDGKLFNVARLRAKTKTHEVLIRDLLFADDAALTSHSEEGLQRLVDNLSAACKEFGLTISLKKTNIMAQGVDSPPTITIGDTQLEAVEAFTYLGSTVTSTVSLDAEISSRIAKAAGVMAKLNKRVWSNSLLSERTKVLVYQACVLSTLLYGSESWTVYARQERRLNSFHLRSLRRLLHIRWQDRVPNTDVLQRAGLMGIPSMLMQRRLRWLGHVHRMEPDRLPREILYGELRDGARKVGRPLLRYKDTIKHDLKAVKINTNSWEDTAANRDAWRLQIKTQVLGAEDNARTQAASKRAARKLHVMSARASTAHVCPICQRDCHSRIGLLSHSRSCRF